MKLGQFVLFLHCLALFLGSCGTTNSNDESRELLVAVLKIIELEYEDACQKRAEAEWDELLGAPNGLQRKLEGDKEFGILASAQTHEVKVSMEEHNALDSEDILRRKIKLLLQPGDTLLETEKWISLVTFAETTLHNLRFGTDYYCGSNTTCTFSELQRSLAVQQQEDTLREIKQSWEAKLPNQTVYVNQILPLLEDASKLNHFNSVEQYWDSLAEYEGAILKARELWEQVKPLYEKLHKYVALRLKGPDAVGKPLPVYLLRSLIGDNWLNVVESLLPKHPDIYQKLHSNLHLKNVGGREAFSKASKLLEQLNFGELNHNFWTASKFDGECPTVIVDSCKVNNIKVFTCNEISIDRYLEAVESVMKVRYKEIAAIHSNNSYILREANRYSALYEAMPGVLSLLALSPHALDRMDLYSVDRFNYNSNHHRLVLQMLIALRDLPRMNYYLAIDDWRLKTLMASKSSSEPIGSWSEYRQNFSMLISSDNDILGDPYVLRNQPYIGKFMGLILKYQIYQSFAEELYVDNDDLIQYVSTHNNRLMVPMRHGYGVIWPEMVSDILAKREYGLESSGLTDYFRLLDEYLDKQLDPDANVEEIEYVDPPVEENEIPNMEEEPLKPMEGKDSIDDNMIDHGDLLENYKQGMETSTVAALEIKNAVPHPDKNDGEVTPIKEASYSVYWWIAIVVGLAVIVILIAIIVRKRQNHRKHIERQRRQNTSA